MPGHIRKRGTRKDGSTRWQARWRHPLDPAERREKTFRNRDVAKRWLSAQETAAHEGSYVDPRKADRPFSELIAAWRRSWDGRLALSTQARYEQVLRVHVEPKLASRRVSLLTHEAIQQHIDVLRDEDVKPGTLRKVHNVLSATFVEGIRLGIVRNNPAQHVRLPRQEHRPMLFLSAEEVAALANAIAPHFRALVYTAAYTGLRSGELAALRWSDVGERITVERSYNPDTQAFGPTKTHAKRAVSMPPFLRTMLREHRLARPPVGTDLVFTMPKGGPLDRRVFFARYFRPAVKAALPPEKHGLRFHDLRHTCASLLIAAGAHPKAIQERLGHRSITLTMDRYGHLLPGLDAALSDPLEAAYRATHS